MYRIVYACVDIVSSLIFILPILLLCNKIMFHNIRHTMLYSIFIFYLIAVVSLVGLPTINDIQIDFSINIIPFIDIISDMKNAILNVLLFIPLGFFLPILWNKYRKLNNTFIVCLFTTSMIEVLQILTFRTTDINDIITNTLGGMIGFYIAKVLTKKFSKLIYQNAKNYELYIIFAITFIVSFTFLPFTSNLLYNLFL